MSRIHPLPSDAISQIHSSKHITSLQGVILALLENSLDAGASKVEITFDTRRGGCTIEDNGSGIPAGEFFETGGLGKMYHTSKHAIVADQELHGSTGTYLASLSALSLLCITSRHADHIEHATITIHQGKVIERKVPAPPGHELTSSTTTGTRVSVRDLFGNMPVRVKQRALAIESGNEDEKAGHELKHGIVALLLAWHKPCSVKFCHSEIESRFMNLSTQYPGVSAALTEKSLNQLTGAKASFDLKDKLPLLFQSGLAATESRIDWVPVSAASSGLSVKGAICLRPVPTKLCQFISLGIHPCSPISSQMHDAVNKIFVNSSFGAAEEDSDPEEDEIDRRRRDRRYKSDGYTQRQLHGHKGVDRWPMFVLQVNLKGHLGMERLDAEKMSDASLKAISDLLEATVRQWLEANLFRPRRKRRRRNEMQERPSTVPNSQVPSPSSSAQEIPPRMQTPKPSRAHLGESVSTSKKRKVLSLSRFQSVDKAELSSRPVSNGYFNTWSRIKSGREAFYDEIWKGKKPATAPEGRLGSKASLTPNSKVAFSLPPLDVGELNSVNSRRGKNAITMSQSRQVGVLCATPAETDYTSSEDFGSVNEEDLVEALKGVEHSCVLNAHGAELIIESDEVTNNVEREPDDSIMQWTDPITKQIHRVNARTGVVLPLRAKSNTLNPDMIAIGHASTRDSAAINSSITSAGRPLTLSKRPSTANKEREIQWLPGFLKEWSNPVFAQPVEERIPVASFDGPGLDAVEAARKRCTHDVRTSRLGEAGATGASKISKAALKEAKVIQQVDRKFILCKTGQASAEVLVLIDQHAASERVILEGLLAELCAPVAPAASTSQSRVKTTIIEKPLHFQISAAESELFEKHALHFADWGILYELHNKQDEMTASQVRVPKPQHVIAVHALPPGIAERCTLMPKLLIELLRAEVWSLSPKVKRSSKAESDLADPQLERDHVLQQHSWFHRIPSCPKGILDMLNSRACRSAIMFNDQLSIAECEQLLKQVSECAFPFTCAHGRASMVPLVQLGDGMEGFGEHGDSSLGAKDDQQRPFSEAYRRWRERDSTEIHENVSD